MTDNESPPSERKGTDMLTLMLKTASGVAILIAVGFCVLFAYVAYTKSLYGRLKDTHDLRKRIEGYAADYMAKRPESGLVIGVIQGTNAAVFAYGHLDGPDSAAPDADTLFEIGSVTKVFTAIAGETLAREGVFSWTNSVRELVPPAIDLPAVFEQMTLEHLASHRSGLPRLPLNLEADKVDLNNPYVTYGTNELIGFLKSYDSKVRPGSTLDYSNLGFGLLGWLCELRTGETLDQVIRSRVALPLGMTNTGGAFGRTNNVAAGHQVDGGSAPYWEFGALAGAGFLKSSLNDLMSFVRANIRPEDSPMGEVLEACQQKRGEAWTGNVGYGWQLTRTLQGQLDFVWHNGGTGGFVSFVGFDRNNGNGVVMLSSSGDAMKGDFYLDTLAMEILKLASKISLD